MSATPAFNKTRALFMKQVSAPELPASLLKLAYLIAFRHMDGETETAIVGQPKLAEELNVDERTVRRLLIQLQQYGLKIEAGNGRGNAATYRINPPAEAVKADMDVHLSEQKGGHPKRERRTSDAPKGGHSAHEKADMDVRPSNKKESPIDIQEGGESPMRAHAHARESTPPSGYFGDGEDSGQPVAEQTTDAPEQAELPGLPAMDGKPDAKSDPDGDELAEAFDEFWSVYPRREGEDAARREYRRAHKRGGNPDDINAGAKRYAAMEQARIAAGGEARYTALAKNWLKDGRWKDQPQQQPGVVIDGVTGEPVAQPPPPRRSGPKTWKEIGEELLAEVGDGTVH